MAGDFSRQEVILPRKTVLELGKLLTDSEDPVTLDILANQVRFRFANVELVSKVVDGKFPDFNRVIPVAYSGVVGSTYFGTPTLVQNARRVNLGLSLRF